MATPAVPVPGATVSSELCRTCKAWYLLAPGGHCIKCHLIDLEVMERWSHHGCKIGIVFKLTFKPKAESCITCVPCAMAEQRRLKSLN